MSNEQDDDDVDPFADMEWEEDSIEVNNNFLNPNEKGDDEDIYEDNEIEGIRDQITLVIDPTAAIGSKRQLTDVTDEVAKELSNEQPKKKVRLKPVKFKEEDFEEVLQRCEQNTVQHIDYLLHVLQWSQDGSLLNAAKENFLDRPLEISLSSNGGQSVANILHLRNAIRSQVKIIASKDMTEDEGRDGSTTEELLHQVIQHRRGSAVQWLQILYTLLRSFRIRCRWLTAIHRLSLHPQDYADLLLKAADDESHFEALLKRGKGQHREFYCNNAAKSQSTVIDVSDTSYRFVCSWLEIWLPGMESFWINITDGLISKTDGPKELQSRRYNSDNVDVLQLEDRRPIRNGFIVRDVSDVFWSIRQTNTSNSVVGGNNGNSSNAMAAELQLRYRSWLRVYLDSVSAPSSTSTNTRDTKCETNDTSISHSHSAVQQSVRSELKIVKIGDEEVINLLEEDEDDVENDPLVPAATNSNSNSLSLISSDHYHPAADDVPVDVDSIEEQEHLLQQFALQHQQARLLKQLPTSLAAFKRHPLYVLGRDLHTDEALLPSAQPVALLKGHSVYLRTSVTQLHTLDGWKRRLHVVRHDARDHPVKTIQRKIPLFILQRLRNNDTNNNTQRMPQQYNYAPTSASASASSRGEDNFRVKEIKYYAEWQTDVMHIAPVDPNTEFIPRNEYGNLEIWDGLPQFVPVGAVYLPGPPSFVDQAAKHLGMQYVPAVVGFETVYLANNPIQPSRKKPKYQGIVVLQRDAALVLEVATQLQAIAEEKEANEKFTAITKKWVKLVRLALNRQALREQFGA